MSISPELGFDPTSENREQSQSENLIPSLFPEGEGQVSGNVEIKSQVGYYTSLSEAIESSAGDSVEKFQLIEFVESGRSSQVIFDAQDRPIKVERIAIEDTDLDYIYSYNLLGNINYHNQRQLKISEEYYNQNINNVIIHNRKSGSAVNIGQRTPCQNSLIQNSKYDHPRYSYNRENPSNGNVNYTRIESVSEIATILHEVGHSWDLAQNNSHANFNINIDSFNETPEAIEGMKVEAVSERNAWAWAMKELRRMRDFGIISTDDQILEKVSTEAEYYLTTYDSLGLISGEYSSSLLRNLNKKFKRSLRGTSRIIEQLNINDMPFIMIPAAGSNSTITISCSLSEGLLRVTVYENSEQGISMTRVSSGDDLIFCEKYSNTGDLSTPDEEEFITENQFKLLAGSINTFENAEENISKIRSIDTTLSDIDEIYELILAYIDENN